MRFPRFTSRKSDERLSSHDETVFAEASELAHLRLQQCIADLRTRLAALNERGDPQDQEKINSDSRLLF